MAESGTVTYTDRAFTQDADLAMAGDIMRGLVELITNCDDAYGPNEGAITVTLVKSEIGAVSIAVGDNGPGLDPEGLKTCFSVLGGKSSGFHAGGDVRGMFGRGAKDTASFGHTTFESIQNDTYGILELSRVGNWTLDSRPASPEDFDRLEIPVGGSGLVATIHAEVNPRRVPPFRKLITNIERHVQLRRITRDRKLTIRNVEPGKPRKTEVVRWNPPTGEVIFDDEIEIVGYGTTAHLVVKKLATPSADAFNAYASHGIEIRGSKAIYENSLFDSRGPEMKWIHGTVTCPKIDELIREFDHDKGGAETNPTPLIRRDRDGLSAEHPFTVALKTAVLRVLAPILDDLKPNTDAPAGGAKLKNDLSQASKQLAALLESDLAKIDDTPITGGDRPSGRAPIKIIPPQTSIRLGKRRTMTVLIDESAIPDPGALTVASTDTSVCSVGPLTAFQPHSTFEGVLIGNFVIDAIDLGRSVVTVHDNAAPLSASATVRVSDAPDAEPEEPTELRWSNSTMSVSAGKTRSITLEAPIGLAPTGTLTCRISVDGRGIELLDDRIELSQNSHGWLSGKCRITGVELGSSTPISATSGVDEADGSVRVTRPSGLDGLGLQIEVLDQAIGDFRASMREEDGAHVITVYARHGGLDQLIGASKSNGSFEHEESREVRVAMTEIIGATIADFLVTREAQRYPAEYDDADAVLAQRNKVLTRYLVALQRLLVHDRD